MEHHPGGNADGGGRGDGAHPFDIDDGRPQGLYAAEDEEMFEGLVSSATRSVEVMPPACGVFGDGEFDLPTGRSGSDLGAYSVESFAPTEGGRASDSVRAAEVATEFDLPGKPVYRSFGRPEGDILAMRRPTAGLDGPLEPLAAALPPVEAVAAPGSAATATATVTAAAGSAESAHPDLTVPALLPYYRLETHTHAKLDLGDDRAAVGAAIDTVSDALRAQKVDFEFKAEKCKWKCCFFLEQACVIFRVRLWKNAGAPRAGEHVLEFQRRHGDGAPFMAFWRATQAALGLAATAATAAAARGPASLSRGPTTALPMPSLGGPPPSLTRSALSSGAVPMPAQLLPPGALLGAAAPPPPSEDDMAAFVTPLKEMVEFGMPDSALAGARGLAQLSACKEHRMVMKKCDVVEALVKFLGASERKPCGCLYFASAQIFAVACLANLSEEPVVQSALYRSCGLLLDQVDNGCYLDRAMRREAARTLRNLAQDDQGTDSIIRQVGKERLQQWCQDTFPRLSDQSIIDDAGIVSDRIRSRWAVCV